MVNDKKIKGVTMKTTLHPPLSVSPRGQGPHHDGTFDFGPPGGAGPVAEDTPVDVGSVPHRHGMPKLARKRVIRMIQMPELKLMCTKDHQ